jgi:hypothetical protein
MVTTDKLILLGLNSAADGFGWNRVRPGTATRVFPPGRVQKTAAF